MRARAPLLAALLTFAVVTGVVGLTLHARHDATVAADRGDAGVSAQVVQLRRDEALGRVEIALTNTGTEQVVVDRLRLRVGGFTGGGWVSKSSPVPAGQLVDLPTPYGHPRCPRAGEPAVGPVRLDLRLVRGSSTTVESVTVVPRASRPVLRRILVGWCTQRQLLSEVHLAFGPAWRTEGSGDATRLHTTIEARLAPGAPPRDLTQLQGNVIYDLAAETAQTPYARLDPAHPAASVPVVVSQARCTGHAKGEAKQPYKFLVWLGDPGSAGLAVELPVSAADKTRLRAVCSL